MTITTFPKRRATAPKLPNSATKTREAFARSAVFAEFGYHAARALDDAGFVDRRPDQGARRINGRPTEGVV